MQIEDDAYQEDLGYTRGTIGKSGTGRIRHAQVDEKTKVRISKTLQKNLQKQQAWGGATSVKKQVSGTASSVAFTPLQVRHIYIYFFGKNVYNIKLTFNNVLTINQWWWQNWYRVKISLNTCTLLLLL